jgi:hypothetical protein
MHCPNKISPEITPNSRLVDITSHLDLIQEDHGIDCPTVEGKALWLL